VARSSKNNVNLLWKEAESLTNDLSESYRQAGIRLNNSLEPLGAFAISLTPYINNTWGVYFIVGSSNAGGVREQCVPLTAAAWVTSLDSVLTLISKKLLLP